MALKFCADDLSLMEPMQVEGVKLESESGKVSASARAKSGMAEHSQIQG